MTWFKIDDKLPKHPKARAVRRSHPAKKRDASPFGLWAIAGALSDDGFIALEVLEEWDDDAEELAARLVDAGLWYAVDRHGEPGYEFHDWHDNNPASASSSGTFGNHVRHHQNRGVVKLDCEHCRATSARGRPDVAPESHPMIASDVAPDSLPVPTRPVPSRPDPTGEPPRSRSETDAVSAGFAEWWDAYDHKLGRKKAETAYRAALRKPGVTPELLLAAATTYIAWVKAEGKYPQFAKHPTTWLNGECWRDERTARPMPQSRVQQGLEVARRLAQAEQTDPIPFPQIGGDR